MFRHRLATSSCPPPSAASSSVSARPRASPAVSYVRPPPRPSLSGHQPSCLGPPPPQPAMSIVTTSTRAESRRTGGGSSSSSMSPGIEPTTASASSAPQATASTAPAAAPLLPRVPRRAFSSTSSDSSSSSNLTPPTQLPGKPYVVQPSHHRAIVAFGSNLGDRVAHIEAALAELRRHPELTVVSTSALYETAPLYVTDQGYFLNGACQIETQLAPLELLDVLQSIENELGRVKIVDKGPRNIDLDIILYDYETIQHERLQVPHKLMLEREFVLKPLADLVPYERLPPPHDDRSITAHLEHVQKHSTDAPAQVVTVMAPHAPLIKPEDAFRRTQVMGILNVTPDSFSDGGQYSAHDLDAISAAVRRFAAAGVTIIDVGGQSTRPQAALVSAPDELARVIPVIRHIRTLPEAAALSISIDTFYAEVARQAVGAGAHIINDVTGGAFDEGRGGDDTMYATAAALRATLVLMHMRGTPQTMGALTDYSTGNSNENGSSDDVVAGVAAELESRVRAAQAAGVPRWRLVLDPGIGFAKTQAQNLELLRRLGELRAHPALRGLAWLVGTSRKGFIGSITGVARAAERGWGSAATVTASVAGGADIVRVHDVGEMAHVVLMSDAMYRVGK